MAVDVPFDGGLHPVQGQEPVFGGPHYGFGAGQRRVRFDEFGRAEGRATAFALIAVRIGVAANGARPDDIAVGQKLVGDLVEILLGHFLHEITFLVEFREKCLRRFVVDLVRRPRINIERDSEITERLLDLAVVFVDNLLRGNAFLFGFDGNRHAVFIGAADEGDVFARRAEVAHVDVGGQVASGQVTDVDRSIGVDQGCRDGIALGIFEGHKPGIMAQISNSGPKVVMFTQRAKSGRHGEHHAEYE